MLSQQVEIAIQVATFDAAKRQHQETGVAHLIYALSLDQETAQLMQACGCDVPRYQGELLALIEAQEAQQATTDPETPPPSEMFKKVFRRAAVTTPVEPHHILSSLFYEPQEEATKRLISAGMTRHSLSRVMLYGPPTSKASTQAGTHSYELCLHNDDTTSMEFVVDVLVTCLGKSEAEAAHLAYSVHHQGVGPVQSGLSETEAQQMLAKLEAAIKAEGANLICSMRQKP